MDHKNCTGERIPYEVKFSQVNITNALTSVK